jgi:hypothetical protein
MFKIDHKLAEFLLRFFHSYWESDLILSVSFLASLLEPTLHCFFFMKFYDVKVNTICNQGI